MTYILPGINHYIQGPSATSRTMEERKIQHFQKTILYYRFSAGKEDKEEVDDE